MLVELDAEQLALRDVERNYFLLHDAIELDDQLMNDRGVGDQCFEVERPRRGDLVCHASPGQVVEQEASQQDGSEKEQGDHYAHSEAPVHGPQ